MRWTLRIDVMALVIVACLVVSSGCNGKKEPDNGTKSPKDAVLPEKKVEPEEPATESVKGTDSGPMYVSVVESFADLVRFALQKKVDITGWTEEDLKSIGTWEYRVVSVRSEASAKGIVAALEDAGKERWECFWVEQTPEAKRFYMKRPVRSILQGIGSGFKFIPMPGQGE